MKISVLICVVAFAAVCHANAKQEQSLIRGTRGERLSKINFLLALYYFVFVLLKAAVKEVSCNFKKADSIYLNREINTCAISANIDSEGFVIKSDVDTSVEQIDFRRNRQIKFLPRNAGEKFPNLKELYARNCGLKVINDNYFKNMGNLIYFNMNRNKISSIQPDAFKDLTNVERIYLEHNQIETLDGKLFATMANLGYIYLTDNKINFLNPTTFKISGGKLREVHLESNTCISASYITNLTRLEIDLNEKCARK